MLYGQLQPTPENAGVRLIGKSNNSAILLRWAPNTPVGWKLALKYGYSIERITLARNNRVLDTPERQLLNNTPIKPWPVESWESLVDQNDNAAIAAQAMYGETFELTENYSSDVLKVINQAKELESRFSFALFAADQSIEVAEASGLYFKDEKIRENENYLYRVFANIPKENLPLDTGFVYLGLKDYVPLPKPRGLKAEFGDKTVLLSWNGQDYYRLYNSFILERSDNNSQTFAPVTNKPIVNTFKDDEPRSRYIFKIDSLEENLKKHVYRVRGISSYGEIGPPSDTVSGFGRPNFEYAASISSTQIVDDGQHVVISWDYPDHKLSDIKSFQVTRADQQGGPYADISGELPSTISEFKDDSPFGSNYYIIKSFDKYGSSNISYPHFIQLEDSIPPSIPKNLSGVIDSLGVVKLSWEKNEEQDLLGYRVFRGNFKSDELVQVTSEPVTDNEFVDTLNTKVLNRDIYYAVQSVDRRFNASERSEAVELQKPDLIPPVPPVFKRVENVKDNEVSLEWVRSSSQDVKHHLIYRRDVNATQWQLIKVFSNDSTEYSDRTTSSGVLYEYTMVAVDESNLESTPSVPVKVKVSNNYSREVIENIHSSVDRSKKSIEIVWDYTDAQVSNYVIYRAEDEQPLSIYSTVSESKLIDQNLKINTSYTYRIKVLFDDGSESKLSKSVKVNY